MTTDPILDELHQVREQFAARFNYDVAAMVAFLREQQAKETDHAIVSFSQPLRETRASVADVLLKQAA